MGIPYEVELQEYRDALKDAEKNIKELDQKIEVLQEENLKLQTICNEKEKILRGRRVMKNKEYKKIMNFVRHILGKDICVESYDEWLKVVKKLADEELEQELLKRADLSRSLEEILNDKNLTDTDRVQAMALKVEQMEGRGKWERYKKFCEEREED